MNIFKSLAYGLLVSSLLVFSGCEGNNSDAPPAPGSGGGGGGNPPIVDVNASTDATILRMIGDSSFLVNGNHKTRDIYIMAFNANHSTNTVGEVSFQWPEEFVNGTVDDVGSISPSTATITNGQVHFVYTPPLDVNRTEGKVSSVDFLFHSKKTPTVTSNFHVDFNSTGTYVGTDPVLDTLILSDSNLSVSSSNDTQTLRLYAFTDQSTTNISTVLNVKYPTNTINNNIDIGTLPANISVVNGIANFSYAGPTDISRTITQLNAAGIAQPIALEIYDQVTNTNVVLNLTFTQNPVVKSYAGYSLTSNPDNVLVTSSKQKSGVVVYLEDNNSRPAAGENVVLEFFDGKVGEMNSFATITDANGRATFAYTAPTIADNNVTANFYNMRFTIDGADLADIPAKLVGISIDTRVAIVDFSTYTLTALPSTLTIKDANESKTVDLYLENNSSRPVVGETILLDYFNGSKGTMNSFSAQTDTNGHVVFNYTAPITVADGALVTLTFRGQNSTLNVVTTLIDVNSSAPADPKYNNYVLTVQPENNVTIVAGLQSDVIDVYLEDNITHLPVENEVVLVKFFDGSKGSMSSFSSKTDRNGHIAFTYTAPDNILSLTDHLLEFSLSESPTVNNSTKVVYSASTPVIRLEDTLITLNTDGQEESVVVLAFNSDTNQTFNSGTIVVEYPSEIVDGSRTGGLFSQSEAVIVNGRAVFAFTGPNPLDANSSLDFTFSYKEDPSVTPAILSVNYTPFVPNEVKVVLVSSEYTATLNSQAISISMNVFKNLRPVTEGEVRVRFPGDVLNGRDVGYFDSTAVTVNNGVVTFSYFAPKNLKENNSSIEFIFYHYVDETHNTYNDDSTVFTLKIEPTDNQIILTDYELRSNLKDENITMNLESSKMLSFYVQETDGTHLSDANITSITVTLLNPTLGNLSDTNSSTNTAKSITSNSKNNLSLRLDTFTKSGILPIKVYTEFKGVNNEDRNITEIYNIVIFSGPPTAISISYSSTGIDKEFAKFKENLVVTVTDKYFNYVNSTPGISVSMIAGYTLDGAGNKLYQEPNINTPHTATKGTLDSVTVANTTTFEVTSGNPFVNVDINNEFLATFGQGYSYAGSGSWNIASVASDKLTLDEHFDSNETQDNLGYAVGNNFRQDTCRAGAEWVGTISSDAINGKLNASGMARLTVNYDYYLTGKDVIVAVNIVGYTAATDITSKIGEAKKITLRSTGLSNELISLSKGFSGVVRLPVHYTDLGTSAWYRNANFGYDIFTDDAVTINSWYSSNDSDYENSGHAHDPVNITSCVNRGRAFVDVDVTVQADKAGTIQLRKIVPYNEF